MVLGGQQDQVNSIRVIKLMRIARTLRIVKTVTWVAQHFFLQKVNETSGADDSDPGCCCKTQKHDEICIQSCGYSCMIAVYLSLYIYIYKCLCFIYLHFYLHFSFSCCVFKT